MQLRYYDTRFGSTQPSYTGNISEWSWCHGGGDYVYTNAYLYDQFSRLKDTKQYIGEIPYNLHADRNLVYDLNGNILTLERDVNGAWIHDFRYSYDGNQLLAVSDHSNPAQTVDNYTYDANGNMTHDGTHKLDLNYNHLDLIEKVTQNGSTLAKYSYLSDGTKLSATNAAGNGLVYQGSLVYKKQGDALTLESALFSEGRFIPMTSYIEPQYFLTDHLGSVRMVLNGARNVIERNNYYAFGQRWEDQNQLISDNRYTYNGKEDQGFLKLPYICFGARQFDPLTGRWFNPDPLAQKRFFSTPYGYCLGNPIVNIDLYGLIDWKTVGKGVAQTIGGGLMMAGGALLTGGTAGTGAVFGGALIVGGTSTAAFGIAKITCGFASDGSEESQKTTEAMPTSVLDVGGIVVDQAMGNENGEARNVVKVVEGVVGIATSGGTSLKDAISLGLSAAQVAEGATDLRNSSQKSSKETTPSNDENPDTQKNYVETTNSNDNEQQFRFYGSY